MQRYHIALCIVVAFFACCMVVSAVETPSITASITGQYNPTSFLELKFTLSQDLKLDQALFFALETLPDGTNCDLNSKDLFTGIQDPLYSAYPASYDGCTTPTQGYIGQLEFDSDCEGIKFEAHSLIPANTPVSCFFARGDGLSSLTTPLSFTKVTLDDDAKTEFTIVGTGLNGVIKPQLTWDSSTYTWGTTKVSVTPTTAASGDNYYNHFDAFEFSFTDASLPPNSVFDIELIIKASDDSAQIGDYIPELQPVVRCGKDIRIVKQYGYGSFSIITGPSPASTGRCVLHFNLYPVYVLYSQYLKEAALEFSISKDDEILTKSLPLDDVNMVLFSPKLDEMSSSIMTDGKTVFTQIYRFYAHDDAPIVELLNEFAYGFPNVLAMLTHYGLDSVALTFASNGSESGETSPVPFVPDMITQRLVGTLSKVKKGEQVNLAISLMISPKDGSAQTFVPFKIPIKVGNINAASSYIANTVIQSTFGTTPISLKPDCEMTYVGNTYFTFECTSSMVFNNIDETEIDTTIVLPMKQIVVTSPNTYVAQQWVDPKNFTKCSYTVPGVTGLKVSSKAIPYVLNGDTQIKDLIEWSGHYGDKLKITCSGGIVAAPKQTSSLYYHQYSLILISENNQIMQGSAAISETTPNFNSEEFLLLPDLNIEKAFFFQLITSSANIAKGVNVTKDYMIKLLKAADDQNEGQYFTNLTRSMMNITYFVLDPAVLTPSTFGLDFSSSALINYPMSNHQLMYVEAMINLDALFPEGLNDESKLQSYAFTSNKDYVSFYISRLKGPKNVLPSYDTHLGVSSALNDHGNKCWYNYQCDSNYCSKGVCGIPQSTKRSYISDYLGSRYFQAFTSSAVTVDQNEQDNKKYTKETDSESNNAFSISFSSVVALLMILVLFF